MAEPERPHNPRHELLSRSDSGLHFVREKKSGIMRQLTDSELNDFDDPAPCEACGEQFGCEHYNCARESLLSEAEIESQVPPDWRPFARDAGVSRNDLLRLNAVEHRDGEYHVAANATSDMRLLEIVLLLNER